MEQIVQAVADGIIVVDGSGVVLFANPAAERLLRRKHGLVGEDFGFPLATRDRTEIEIVRPDGALLIVEMRVSELRHGEPAVTSYLVSLRDVTDRKRAETAINRLNASLGERVRELESYTHSVSHDLQGPLRTIRSYTGIVLEEAAELPPELRNHLSRIQVNAERMSNLIRDLLRLSRSSLATLQLEQVDLRALVMDVVRKIKDEDRSGAKFVLGDLPAVTGDPALLAQVFENLFSNAIKYARPGVTPQITVECRTEHGLHQLAVRDNGEGFAPEYAEKIFRLFERLHSSEEIAGTGIGLSIVQRAIGRHGGRVWAESMPHRGATFYFTLPVDPEQSIDEALR